MKLRCVLCRASTKVEAAQRELAGAEAGDGRDESNRSLQERLTDAQNAQVGLCLPALGSTKEKAGSPNHLLQVFACQECVAGLVSAENRLLRVFGVPFWRMIACVRVCVCRLA
jgi:hypothetical protein